MHKEYNNYKIEQIIMIKTQKNKKIIQLWNILTIIKFFLKIKKMRVMNNKR
jgi:hypothetical protein